MPVSRLVLSWVVAQASVTTEPPPETSEAAIANGWDEPEPEPEPAEPRPTPDPEAQRAAVEAAAAKEAQDRRAWQLRQHNRFRGMMISGFTILGAVYGGSVLVGALAIDLGHDNDSDRQLRYGRRMFIPLGGPFAAAPVSRSATLGVLTVAAGAGQVLGLSLGIAGAVKMRQFPNPDRDRFAFGVTPTPDGAALGVVGRF
jgi:hypothetical protein